MYSKIYIAGNLNDWGESIAQLGRRYDPTEGPAAWSPIGPIVNAAFASDTHRCHVLLASAALGPLHRQGSVMSHGDSDRARHRDLDRRYGQRAPKVSCQKCGREFPLVEAILWGPTCNECARLDRSPFTLLGKASLPTAKSPERRWDARGR